MGIRERNMGAAALVRCPVCRSGVAETVCYCVLYAVWGWIADVLEGEVDQGIHELSRQRGE